MGKKTFFSCIVLMASSVLLGGCPRIEVQTRTRVYADGTALRETTICQIDDADAAPTWLTHPTSLNAGPTITSSGDNVLEGLVFPDTSKYLTYEKKEQFFHAVGFFATPNEIVQDYVRPAEYIEKASKNSFSFTTDDYVLFKRFAYSENYTDIVDRESYSEAVDKGFNILAELCLRVMDAEYGKDYDLSTLRKVVGTDALSLAREAARLNYEVRAQNSSMPADVVERMVYERVFSLLGGYGLTLEPEKGNDKRIRDFVAAKLVEFLKPKRPEVSALPLQRAKDFVENELEKKYQDAIVEKYGSDAEFEKEIGKIAEQVFGINFSSPETKFSLEAQMPGMILSSNGVFSGSKAILEFWDDDLYPLGRGLSVVSVLYNEQSLNAIARKTLLTREKMEMARTFLAFEPDTLQKVLAAVKEGVSARSLEPIRELKKDLPADMTKHVESILGTLE